MNALGSFPEVILAEVMDASKSELPVLGRLIRKIEISNNITLTSLCLAWGQRKEDWDEDGFSVFEHLTAQEKRWSDIAKQRAKRREEILHPDRLKSSFEL